MLKSMFTKGKSAQQMSNSEIVVFCEEMSIIMKAGISVIEGCYILRDNTKNTEDREVFSKIIEKLEEGESFSKAVKTEEIFPHYMVNMIEIGEISGRLEQVFHALFLYYKKEGELARLVKSSVTYPVFILIMMLVVISSIIFYVLPIFSTVYQQLGSSNTGITGAILEIGMSIKENSTVILAVFVLLIVLASFLKFTKMGMKIRKNFVSKVLVNNQLFRKIAVSRFTNGMTLLLSSGVDMDKSLELVEELVENAGLKSNISNTRKDIAAGESFAVAIEKNNILKGIYAKMLSIGVKTGTVEEVIQNISNRYEEEVERDLVKLISIVEPLLIGILAVVVGGVLLAVMLPLVNIISQIG